MSEQPSSELKRYYTLEELAQAWCCSVRHIQRMITSGRLEASNIGLGRYRKLRIHIDAIRAAEAESTRRAAPQKKERLKRRYKPKHLQYKPR